MNHEFPSAALLKLNGKCVGMPFFAVPAEMLQDLPLALRTKLKARAQESRSKMLDAAQRALDPQPRASAPATVEPKYLPNAIGGCAVCYNEPIFNYDSRLNNDNLPIVFRPGCFGDLDSSDILLTNGHEWELAGHILARTGDGTLGLESRADGVYFTTSRLEDTPYTRWAVSAIRDGRLKGASVGCEPIQSRIGYFDGLQARICTKVELGHVALVDSPACKGAWIKMLESI